MKDIDFNELFTNKLNEYLQLGFAYEVAFRFALTYIRIVNEQSAIY